MKEFFEQLKDDKYGPKKVGSSKSYTFESKCLIDGENYIETLCQVTEWENGEGFDTSFSVYNQKTKNIESKQLTFHRDELNLILAGLNKFKYFEI